MFCKNCGKNIEVGLKKCPHCGKSILNEPISKEIKNKYYTQNDELLIREYMGRKADTFLIKDYSIGIFFLLLIFGSPYLMFRKLYLYGIIWMIASVGISFIPEVGNYVGIFNLIIAVIVSIFFKDMYLKQAQDKVNEIKGKNPTANTEELRMLARNKGGTNILVAIVFGAIYFLSLLSLGYTIFTNIKNIMM